MCTKKGLYWYNKHKLLSITVDNTSHRTLSQAMLKYSERGNTKVCFLDGYLIHASFDWQRAIDTHVKILSIEESLH